MLRRFVKYWLEPFEADFECGELDSVYNRMWYLLVGITLFMWIIVIPCVFLFLPSRLHVPVFTAGLIVHALNLLQFSLQEVLFPEAYSELKAQGVRRYDFPSQNTYVTEKNLKGLGYAVGFLAAGAVSVALLYYHCPWYCFIPTVALGLGLLSTLMENVE